MAAFAPIPRARVSTTVIVRPLVRASERHAKRRSFMKAMPPRVLEPETPGPTASAQRETQVVHEGHASKSTRTGDARSDVVSPTRPTMGGGALRHGRQGGTKDGGGFRPRGAAALRCLRPRGHGSQELPGPGGEVHG